MCTERKNNPQKHIDNDDNVVIIEGEVKHDRKTKFANQNRTMVSFPKTIPTGGKHTHNNETGETNF